MANNFRVLTDLLDDLGSIAGAQTAAGRNARKRGQDDLANLHAQQATILAGIAMRLRVGIGNLMGVNHGQH